jgi:hypothetical protein
MEQDFQYDVFLSHSAKDKAVVRPLAERLRTGRPEAFGRRRKEGTGILHSAFILLPFPSAPFKGSLTQFLYTNWRPTIP